MKELYSESAAWVMMFFLNPPNIPTLLPSFESSWKFLCTRLNFHVVFDSYN